MKTKIRVFNVVLAMICMIGVSAFAAFAGESTITGTVTEDFQIITNDGEAYDVTGNEKSGELMEHVGKTVRVTGTLSEEDDARTITVSDFMVLVDDDGSEMESE
jgi:hypothetical protein